MKPIVLLMSIVFILQGYAVSAGPMGDRANTIYDSISTNFSDSSSLADSYQRPLLSDGGEVLTLDGNSSFQTGVMCTASNNYLTVTGSSDASGETRIEIRFDSDLDGHQESSQIIDNISGYCSNGFIRCQAGTWENCEYHLWSMSDAGLNAVQVSDQDIQQLTNCHCANAACLPVPQDHITDNTERLGTSIAATAQAFHEGYTISEVEKDASSISFFGQAIGDCYQQDSTNLTGYYSNPSAMKNDGAVASETNHVFQLVQSSQPIMNNQTNELLECAIRRDLSASPMSTDTGVLQMFSQGKNYVHCDANFATGEVTCETDGLHYEANLNNTIDLGLFCQNENTIQVIGSQWWTNPASSSGRIDKSVNYRMSVAPECANQLIGRFEVRDNTTNNSDTSWFLAREFQFSWQVCEIEESITDECAGLQSDQTCTLYHEIVDGIQTVENGVATGAQVPEGAQTVYSSTCAVTVQRPFFNVQRTYLCESDNQPHTVDLTRFQEPTGDESSVQFQVGNNDYSVSRPGPEQPACTLSCKVNQASLDTAVNQAGIAALNRSDQNRGDLILKQCIDAQCPLSAGQTLVEDCQCSDNFADAAIALQMLRLANQDLECDDTSSSPEDCVGQIEVFKGRETSCRTHGTQTGFRNCCDLGGKVFDEQYGNPVEAQTQAISQMASVFDALAGGNGQEVIEAFDYLVQHTPLYVAGEGYAEAMNWLFSPCAEDSGPAALISSDMCVQLGEECIEEWEFQGCVQEQEVHCCFKTMLARILHEQARSQFPAFDFGDISSPNCRGFTLEEFQAIDFSRIDFTELEDTIKTQAESVIQDNMETTFEEFQQQL